MLSQALKPTKLKLLLVLLAILGVMTLDYLHPPEERNCLRVGVANGWAEVYSDYCSPLETWSAWGFALLAAIIVYLLYSLAQYLFSKGPSQPLS